MRSSVVLALVLAAGASAAPPRVVRPTGPVRYATFTYINLQTGERVTTPYAQEAGDPVWENRDFTGNGNYFWNQDDPVNPTNPVPTPATGSEAMDWGDHGDFASGLPVPIDGFEIRYATNIGVDPQALGVQGLGAVIRFYNDEDGGLENDGVLAREITLNNLPGSNTGNPQAFTGRVLMVDLEGTPNVFNIQGQDIDGDGKYDFGYSYNWVQNHTHANHIIGPMLVLPANAGGQGTSTGVEDGFNLFTTPVQVGPSFGLWFGGHTPTIPPGQAGYQPYASFFMRLFSSGAGGCYPDCDDNGTLNVNDYICFQTKFALGDPYADCDNNGVRNVNDYICFQTKFALGC